MSKSDEIVDVVERYTYSHRDVAVRASTAAGYRVVYLSGEEKLERNFVPPGQSMNPGDRIEVHNGRDFAEFIAFELGTYDCDRCCFNPSTQALSADEFLRRIAV